MSKTHVETPEASLQAPMSRTVTVIRKTLGGVSITIGVISGLGSIVTISQATNASTAMPAFIPGVICLALILVGCKIGKFKFEPADENRSTHESTQHPSDALPQGEADLSEPEKSMGLLFAALFIAVVLIGLKVDFGGIKDRLVNVVNGEVAISKARLIVKHGLKSPSSYKESASRIVWSGKNNSGIEAHVVEVKYEATNSYGGSLSTCQWISFTRNEGKLEWSPTIGIESCPSEWITEDVLMGLIKEKAFGLNDKDVASTD